MNITTNDLFATVGEKEMRIRELSGNLTQLQKAYIENKEELIKLKAKHTEALASIDSLSAQLVVTEAKLSVIDDTVSGDVPLLNEEKSNDTTLVVDLSQAIHNDPVSES